MKKIIRFFIIALVLCFILAFCVNASGIDVEESFSLGEYVKERIVPIVAGVISSLVGLCVVLSSIFKALKGLKNEKKEMSENEKKRNEIFKEETAALKAQVDDVKESVNKLIEQLDFLKGIKSEIDFECEELGIIGEILVLGFSSNSEIVKTGKGKQINLLLDKLKGDAQNEKA